uniref:Uncharacterized protein n=1 Tax=Ostreococcus sp. 'lucimarinus' TaxID=242159 RepID=A0A7R9T3M6_9CHLO
MPTAVAPRASPHPELTVFDLDACTWDKEMFELREIVDPTRSRRGSLGPDCGEGVVAAMSGNTPIALHPGALRAFQQIWLGTLETLETRAAAASSADTPLAVRIGRSALDVLEVFPGVTVRQSRLKLCRPGFGEPTADDLRRRHANAVVSIRKRFGCRIDCAHGW